MDNQNSDQLHLKKILVDLEDEHEHLQASIGHLKNEIEKREIDIQKLLADRELALVRKGPNLNSEANLHSVEPEEGQRTEYSSEFAKSVGQLLENIARTSEEVSSLIKL